MPLPLEIDRLGKSYGSLRAVDDVSLQVGPGEVVGLLGPNGAGKTTTSRIALGFLEADEGEVRILGERVNREDAGFRENIGYLPGEVTMRGGATGKEVLSFLSGFRLKRAQPALREELIERFEFDPSKKVRTYSKGNRQKLGLIAALQNQVPLIIFDEPTSGLDPLVQQTLLEVLRERSRDGSAVLFSSHVLSEVQAICDRVAVMRQGRLVLDEPVSELGLGSRRRVEVVFSEGDPPPLDLPGIHGWETQGSRARFQYEGEAEDLLAVLRGHRVADVVIERPELEDLFLSLYSGDDSPKEGAA